MQELPPSKYKLAVKYFRANPAELKQAWLEPYKHPHGYLFSFCSPDGHTHQLPNGKRFGCPLMIAGDKEYVAWTPKLTEKCRELFPKHVEELTDNHLKQLAYLQQDMDETIRNRDWLKENRYAAWEGSDTVMLVGMSVLPEDSEEEESEE